MNPLRQLVEAGQSIWLDYLRRSLLTEGGLQRLIDEDGVGGLTSNPTIFGRAISGSTDYDEPIRELASAGETDPRTIFYELAMNDIRMAADIFRPTFDRSNGADGFVSFELEPSLAHDTRGSIDAARELVERVGRPNLMIKVPGTPEGVPAVEELTAAGVNVNITLLFSVDMYEQVARAYIAGLQRRLDEGESLDRVASVASFFVSRVDGKIDALLPEGSPLAGKVGIANAKVAYAHFQEILSGPRWDRLAAAGARLQRPLWASTGTKNPAYSDVLYVEELIGPHTVNTMPEATLDAYRDHGTVRPLAATEDVDKAGDVLAQLRDESIDLDEITNNLIDEGIATFITDFDTLMSRIQAKTKEVRSTRPSALSAPPALEERVEHRLERLRADDIVERMWRGDHTVWNPRPTEIVDRLGWLHVPEPMREQAGALRSFAEQAAADGFTDAVVLGMGGSSLAPEVLSKTLGGASGMLRLTVLDTTHPGAVTALQDAVDLSRTLFVVASKSGTTVETLSHFAYFHNELGTGDQFVAVTDRGTPLEELAQQHGFRALFLNPSDIGGRYSALSLFGLVPAALMGVDLDGLLESAEEMAAASARCVPCRDNPGAWLGVVIGEAARSGHDKLTVLSSDALADVGPWIEQLVAESTGKEGKGILPVVGEEIGQPDVYGPDRVFVVLGDAGSGVDELEAAGHPVVRLAAARERLGAEFFRWEVATAVGGHVLGINPFDQPDVAAAKEATTRVLNSPGLEAPDLGDLPDLLSGVAPGDYVSIQAFLQPTEEVATTLDRARIAIRDHHRVATTVGFGPRYLHSTGQLHKGGPGSGAFIQVVDDRRVADVPIPGAPYTFGSLIDAQATGDLLALRDRGRRAVRVTLDRLMEVA